MKRPPQTADGQRPEVDVDRHLAIQQRMREDTERLGDLLTQMVRGRWRLKLEHEENGDHDDHP